jgi:ketosteroid isomerase-like protein
MSHAELSPDDVGAIEALFPIVAERFLAGDFAGWASVYAEDGMVMPPNGPTVVGRANLQAFGESFPKVTHLSFSDIGVQVQGDLAVGWCGFQMTIVGDDGVEVNDTGKQLVAFEKQGDGSWKATRAMFNSDLPLE